MCISWLTQNAGMAMGIPIVSQDCFDNFSRTCSKLSHHFSTTSIVGQKFPLDFSLTPNFCLVIFVITIRGGDDHNQWRVLAWNFKVICLKIKKYVLFTYLWDIHLASFKWAFGNKFYTFLRFYKLVIQYLWSFLCINWNQKLKPKN